MPLLYGANLSEASGELDFWKGCLVGWSFVLLRWSREELLFLVGSSVSSGTQKLLLL